MHTLVYKHHNYIPKILFVKKKEHLFRALLEKKYMVVLLDIQFFYGLCMRQDKVLPGLHVFSHQDPE